MGGTFRKCPCLVKYDRIELICLFQDFPPLDQDALLRTETGPHHDCRGRRQSHGTGAGNNQDGHEVEQCPAECWFGHNIIPDHEGCDCNNNDHGDEYGCHLICKSLYRGLRSLGLFDEHDNLGQHRLRSHLRRFIDDTAALIDCAGKYPAFFMFLDGDTFSRQHGFVDCRTSLYHGSICRYLFSRTHKDRVSHNDSFNWDIAFLSVLQNMGNCWPQLDEVFYCL